jgi:hypothetical protein
MALILMAHELHGRMHAYSSAQVEALEKLGWVVEVPKPAVEPALPEFADTAPAELETGPTVASVRAELDALGIAYDRRWGLDRLLSLKG